MKIDCLNLEILLPRSQNFAAPTTPIPTSPAYESVGYRWIRASTQHRTTSYL